MSITDDKLKAIEAMANAAQEYIDVGARENWCNVKLVDFAAAMNPKMALRFCSDLRAAREIVKIVAKIDIDFIPKGDTFRDVVLKARKTLGEE